MGFAVVAATFIFQSTLDTPLAMGLLLSLMGIYLLLTSFKLHGFRDLTYSVHWSPPKRSSVKVNKPKRAEFLRRSGMMTPQGSLWKSPKGSPAWSNSPVNGVATPSSLKGTPNSQDYYSTFHRTPNRKKFSQEEWKDFTEQSTREALTDWASSPEFADWIMKNADRIQLRSDDTSDESIGSGPDLTEDNIAQSSSGRGFLWQYRL